MIYDGIKISFFRKQAFWVYYSFRITDWMCLLLNCLCDLAKKRQYVQLYSYFLFRVNLNQKIMTHDNNATDTLDCDLWSIDPHRCRVILYVQRTFSSMSLFGCAVISLLIITLKKYNLLYKGWYSGFLCLVSSEVWHIYWHNRKIVPPLIAASNGFFNNTSIVRLYYGFWWSPRILYL